jgi:DNA topoisomerase I
LHRPFPLSSDDEISVPNFFWILVCITIGSFYLNEFFSIPARAMNMTTIHPLSHRQHQAIDKDHRQAAETVHLVYITGNREGILRHKKGKEFSYLYKGKIIRDKEQLLRIKRLAIPPSWSDVWICASSAGHIQATGLDLNGRKQYRYHTSWNTLRNETKFHRMIDFGKALPLLRKKTHKDISGVNLTAEKVLATTIRLMEETCIRIGNNGYEKLYGSYGLTTLKDKHVSFHDNKAIFCFTGKKGIEHRITLKNKKLAGIIKQCKDIPGKELFQYYEDDGSKRTIDSGMVNNYIKEATRGDFSAKDFRTWAGSLQALECFCAIGEAMDTKEVRKKVVSVLDDVSARLGNTRNVCKKYYVHPLLIRLYEENKLPGSILQVNGRESSTKWGLSKSEKMLMKLLQRFK